MTRQPATNPYSGPCPTNRVGDANAWQVAHDAYDEVVAENDRLRAAMERACENGAAPEMRIILREALDQ